MYNPYMNPYSSMPPSLHPQKSGAKMTIVVIVVIVIVALMVMVFGHKGPLIVQNTTTNNSVHSDSHKKDCCIS